MYDASNHANSSSQYKWSNHSYLLMNHDLFTFQQPGPPDKRLSQSCIAVFSNFSATRSFFETAGPSPHGTTASLCCSSREYLIWWSRLRIVPHGAKISVHGSGAHGCSKTSARSGNGDSGPPSEEVSSQH